MLFIINFCLFNYKFSLIEVRVKKGMLASPLIGFAGAPPKRRSPHVIILPGREDLKKVGN
jgi:hypothetical protein